MTMWRVIRELWRHRREIVQGWRAGWRAGREDHAAERARRDAAARGTLIDHTASRARH